MILYKKDSKGKIRQLEIRAIGTTLLQRSGLVVGKKVEHTRVCKPKNVGKSNETTAEEQAIREAAAKVKQKLDEGYFKSIEEATNNVVVLPMLAQEYKAKAKKINWDGDVYIQPKLDGMRCLAVFKGGKVTLISRKNKVLENLDHIIKDLEANVTYRENLVLDGELYVHGEGFQTNMQYIKKYRKGKTERIKFHVYDIIMEDSPFTLRKFEIWNTVLSKETRYVKRVQTYKIKTEREIATWHQLFLTAGYEGTMVRHSNDGYKLDSRASQLLKYKDFKDIACKIVDIGPADKRPTWGRPVVEWNGKRFACNTKMTHAQKEDLLTNKDDYIGKTAEVRYFEETDSGIPRFPVLVGIRLDK